MLDRLIAQAAVARTAGERGQTLAEYAVVLGVITIAIVVALQTLDASAAGLIETVASRV